MKLSLPLISSAVILTTLGGCSMCCGPYDYDYPTFGGKHERVDRTYGRVGSVFSDPQAGYGGDPADSNRELSEPLSNPKTEKTGDGETDADIEAFKKELESISPKPKSDLNLDNELEELPEPPNATKGPTAQRMPRSRSQWQWR